jgi:hypothetical protein
MSESSFPFQGQTAVMDAAGQEPLQGERNNRKTLALVGLAAVLVLGLVAAYVFLVAGGDEGDGNGASAGRPAAAPAVPTEETAAPAKVEKTRISAKSFGRDPFKALIVEPAEAVAAEDSTPVGSAPVSQAPDTGTGATTPETSAPAASSSHSFRVVEVTPDNSAVTVKLDGKLHENLKAGEVFATYFKVILISGEVNSFQYGEEKFNVAGNKKLTIA